MRKDQNFQVGEKTFTLSLLNAKVIKAREFSRSTVSGTGGGGNSDVEISTTHTDHQTYWVAPVEGGPEVRIDDSSALLPAREGHIVHHLSLVRNDGGRIPVAMQNETTGDKMVVPLGYLLKETGMNVSAGGFGMLCLVGGIVGSGLAGFATSLPWWFALQVAVSGWLVYMASKSARRRRRGRPELMHFYSKLRLILDHHSLKRLYEEGVFDAKLN